MEMAELGLNEGRKDPARQESGNSSSNLKEAQDRQSGDQIKDVKPIKVRNTNGIDGGSQQTLEEEKKEESHTFESHGVGVHRQSS